MGGGEKALACQFTNTGSGRRSGLSELIPQRLGPELRKPRANVREIMNGAQPGPLSGSWGLQQPEGCSVVHLFAFQHAAWRSSPQQLRPRSAY